MKLWAQMLFDTLAEMSEQQVNPNHRGRCSWLGGDQVQDAEDGAVFARGRNAIEWYNVRL